jgi:lipid A 3-O-deacylase
MRRPAAVAALALATPAHADALWLGVYDHDVTLAQTRFETGADLKAGWMGDRIEGLRALGRPSPHVLVSKSLNGGTNYIAAGVDWTFGKNWYVRPGIGLAVHDGPSRAYRKGKRVDLGSPILFEPELALGRRLSGRVALEASWIHLSHGTLFSRQNRGMDSWGMRMIVRLSSRQRP